MTRSIFALTALMAVPLLASAADLSGDWELTFRRFGQDDYVRFTLKADGDKLTGNVNELKLEGTQHGNTVELTAHRPGGDLFGTFHGTIEGDEMKGDALWFGKQKLTWTARRAQPQPSAHKVHEFQPTEFHRQFSGAIAPVLHIAPGDTVRTWTVDAGGVDQHGEQRSLGGNPETGPFYIDGAFPGDTLVVKLNKVRLNRDSAGSGSEIASNAVTPDYVHAGLQSHRSIGDLMRYAAMNRGILDGGDGVANHNGFIPADAPRFQKLPEPATRSRYSDEQLYALALYVYSLQPPPNPNKFDAAAARGQKVFERENCATCHPPPLYTNNKLTPAEGFTIPADHRKKYDILPISHTCGRQTRVHAGAPPSAQSAVQSAAASPSTSNRASNQSSILVRSALCQISRASATGNWAINCWR